MSEASAKVMYVNRRTVEQKEVRIAMTDGRYGKNEVEIHWVGLGPGADITQVVDQAWAAMNQMQKLNSKHLQLETKTDKLPAKKELPE
jgi:hypothetical protein